MTYMTPNNPYDPSSLLHFQVSMLSLAAALDAPDADEPQHQYRVALGEAEGLKSRLD